MTVAGLWESLELAHVPDGAGYVKRRLRPELPIDVFIGIVRPAGRRCLLLSAAGVTVDELPVFSGSRGIASKLVTEKGMGQVLEISLVDPSFADFFDRLVDDVVTALPPGSGPLVVAFAIARLARWQKFLRASAVPLGDEAQRGLYGELWFLRDHVFGVRGFAGVGSWTGPSRAAQDFQFPELAVEVKTSIADQDQAIRIVSERQLDDVGIPRLYLFHLSIDRRIGNTGSLPELIESLRGLIADSPFKDAFEEKLAESGYGDADSSRYAQPCYTVREQNLFRVKPGFPRLTEAVLPAGVGDVHYSIRLSACKPFRVDFAELA